MIDKKLMIELLEKTIKTLQDDTEDSYKFSVEIIPETSEMLNWNGKGRRFTKYSRIITIEDKFGIEEEIKKEIW